MRSDNEALPSIVEDHARSYPVVSVPYPEDIEPRWTSDPTNHELESHVDVPEEMEEPQISEPDFDLEL